MATHTIDAALRELLGDRGITSKVLEWPPEVFATSAVLLKLSGAYACVLDHWPQDGWASRIEATAASWRSAVNAAEKHSPPILPNAVLDLWKMLLGNAGTAVGDIRGNELLSRTLVELMALSDCACVGFGLPVQDRSDKAVLGRARKMLLRSGTLTEAIPTSRLRVLPKQHTPRSGFTLRSMSHHLSLNTGGEVDVSWYWVPHTNASHFNLLLAPWPLVARPRDFRESETPPFMPKKFGCVEILSRNDRDDVRVWLTALLAKARDTVGRIDGIVFPECALSPEAFEAVAEIAQAHEAFVVAGIHEAGSPAQNFVRFEAFAGATPMRVDQPKHHRWRIDRAQVEMYGLGSALDPSRDWWEYIQVARRSVRFLAMNGDLTMCCLVCEDLARRDPVAEVVRAVGPNLVIALLMDGPQLANRWPARYATVLADDPGSSVLTLTSLGMAELSKPPKGASRSRAIALWKDPYGGVQEIDLPPGTSGAVLCLRTRYSEEWTADGRSDGAVAAYPELVGVHAVRVDASPSAV